MASAVPRGIEAAEHRVIFMVAGEFVGVHQGVFRRGLARGGYGQQQNPGRGARPMAPPEREKAS